LQFKTCLEAHASIILDLRTDARLNKYLSPTSRNLEDQKLWIKKYKERESKRVEFYFIIEDLAGAIIGTVRIYDIDIEKSIFTTGSWLVREGSDPRSAVEALLAVEQYAFVQMDLNANHFDVRKDNRSVIRFHLEMGAKIVHENELNCFLVLDRVAFLNYISSRYPYKKIDLFVC
jgi:RimJ/RimL family protein N-acetyltransferase